MKIAKIFAGNPANQKGQFNNIIERTKRLKGIEPNVDCYMIRIQYSWLGRLLKKQFAPQEKPGYVEVQGVTFKNLWITMGLIDYFLTYKLGWKLTIANRQLKKIVPLIKQYDLLSVHTYEAVTLASYAKKTHGIPFVSTWHGSDINFTPFKNSLMTKKVESLLNEANHNFFVSEKLLETAKRISSKPNKSVLYTGPAEFFTQYTDEKIQYLKTNYNFKHKFVVGFIGNFVSVKNILVLPEIFNKIQMQVPNVDFVVVGNGELDTFLRKKFQKLQLNNVHFIGKLQPQQVPEILNCMSVLLLPSLNEGLPRVALEAQACGVPVVGSNRGGIPEAIGEENCFELDDSFVHRASERAIELMKNSVQVALPDKFSWERALDIEKACHERITEQTH